MKFVVSILLRRRIETRRVLLLNLGLSCIPTHISRYAAPGILVILYSIQAATRNDREGMENENENGNEYAHGIRYFSYAFSI
jgi:hypothetical protein